MKNHRSVGSKTLHIVDEIFSALGLESAPRDRINSIAYVERTIDPSRYDCWREFFQDYLFCELLSKWQHFDLGVDKSKVALEKFLSSEQKCYETNLRVRSFNRTVFKMTDRLPQVIQSAKGKIEDVLHSSCPICFGRDKNCHLIGSFNWNDMWPYMGFGPGASCDVNRAHGDAFYKFGLRRPSTTGENLGLAAACVKLTPGWETILLENSELDSIDGSCFSIINGNKVTTVPKNAKTDRVIAIEPTMNMFVQKGIGGYLRRVLKRRGVNLDSQKRNQELAQAGSKFGQLATLDLSAASDTIAMGLVELLFPPDWVTAIKACRSPVGTLPDGTVVRYQKVSSMGNGFTFELESMIFWALCSAVLSTLNESESQLAVYGDDLIVPVSSVGLLSEVLDWCGFTLNQKKSFSSGPFRESCGKHFFLGRDVTPLYIKDHVENLDRKIWLANSIRELAHRLCGFDYGCDSRLLGVYSRLRDSLPRRYQKPSIPRGYGDGALQGDFDEATPSKAKFGLEGWSVRFSARIFKYRVVKGLPLLCKGLHRLEQMRSSGYPSSDGGVMLDRINLVKCRRVLVTKRHVPRWEGFGPWIEVC